MAGERIDWGNCRLCDSSFEFEGGLPAACSNPDCITNNCTDDLEQAGLFAVAVGFLEFAPNPPESDERDD